MLIISSILRMFQFVRGILHYIDIFFCEQTSEQSFEKIIQNYVCKSEGIRFLFFMFGDIGENI